MSKIKRIIVGYWFSDFEKSTGIAHNTKYKYSKKKRNEIIDLVMDAGLNVMLVQQKNDLLVIWIDDSKFRQR